jgi:hypothetical protein
VRQTHISVVFLAAPYVYKVKKPVDFGFLDFSTLEKRHHFCAEEVRLNHRLAPEVYLDVVPIVRKGVELKLEGPGETVEWAVKMQRLPDEATLLEWLGRGEVGPELVDLQTPSIWWWSGPCTGAACGPAPTGRCSLPHLTPGPTGTSRLRRSEQGSAMQN